MKLFLCLLIVCIPFKSLLANHIFHLEKKNGQCEWKLYNVKKDKDKTYFSTEKCPNQIVWLKDKSFYYSIGSDVFWANRWVKDPVAITNIKTARQGHFAGSEVICCQD